MIIWDPTPSYTDWTVEQRIDIAFTISYYGLQLHTKQVLSAYDPVQIQKVLDFITRTRQKNEALANPKDKRRFPGHQNRLSHYFRNLYNAYKFIDNSVLDTDDKTALAQVLRAKLSNYEQALLILNISSHLGKSWERDGIVCRYWPFKNVPKHFFSFDKGFSPKERFPCVTFEWEAH